MSRKIVVVVNRYPVDDRDPESYVAPIAHGPFQGYRAAKSYIASHLDRDSEFYAVILSLRPGQ